MHTIRIHSLDHGRAALAAAREAGRAGRPVRLLSPPGGGGLAGIGWWRELVRLLRAEFPDQPFEAVLDCGPSAGLALAAIRAGIGPLWLETDAATLARLASIAEQAGSRAGLGGKATLDLLGEHDPGTACREAFRKDREGTEA